MVAPERFHHTWQAQDRHAHCGVSFTVSFLLQDILALRLEATTVVYLSCGDVTREQPWIPTAHPAHKSVSNLACLYGSPDPIPVRPCSTGAIQEKHRRTFVAHSVGTSPATLRPGCLYEGPSRELDKA